MSVLSWVGGTGTLWSTAANWSPAQVPIAGDDLILSGAGAVTADLTAAFLSINMGAFESLNVTQSVKITSETFQVDGNSGATWATNGFDIEITDGLFEDNNACITYGTDKVIFSGTANVNVSKAGASNAFYDIEVNKTGGSLDFSQDSADTTNLMELKADTISYNVRFHGTNTNTINKLVTTGIGAFRTSISSHTGAPPADLAITDFTVTNENSNWQDINVSGGTLNCNSATCTDNGGNTNINFVVVVVTVPKSKFASALQSLLPTGKLFNRVAGSWLTKLLCGFATECERFDDRVDDYMREGVPDGATLANGLLEEWERAVGLPTLCIPIAATEPERLANLLYVLTDIGGNAISYWEQRASDLGFPGTFVTEVPGPPPFMIGISAIDVDVIGDNVYYNQFTWIVNFPIGSVGTEQVECDFEEKKPAHTNVLFNTLTGAIILLEDGSPLTDELGFPIEEE